MAVTQAFGSSEAVSTTEWSLPRDLAYAAGSPQATAGVYQLFLNLADMVTGDELQIRIYEKVLSGGAQVILYESYLVGAQPEAGWVSPSLMLMHGWDMTVKVLVGGITIEWSIRTV